MYLAQERSQLDAYIITHELEGIQRNGFGMFELRQKVKERQQNLEIKSSTMQRFIYWMIVV